MSNRFKQSIDNLSKSGITDKVNEIKNMVAEAKKEDHEAVTAYNEQLNQILSSFPANEDVSVGKTAGNKEAGASQTVSNPVLNNILDSIPAKEPQGKNYAFYLSHEIGEAVTKVAKQKGISKSKLVENILKQVLLHGSSASDK